MMLVNESGHGYR